MLLAKTRLGNSKYNALRNELLGKTIKYDKHKNSTKSNKISDNTTLYYPNNTPVIPYYSESYPPQ